MNRHTLHYIDLNTSAEPSGFVVWCGAALALVALYLMTVFLFSL